MNKFRSFILEMALVWGTQTTLGQVLIRPETEPVGEFDLAEIIIMHEPGDEIFLGALHPSAALFQTYMDRNKIVAEHRNYRRELEAAGVRVFSVQELLLDDAIDDHGNPIPGPELEALRALASQFLTYNTSELPEEYASVQEQYRRTIIRTASPDDLVKIILMQPKVSLSPTRFNTHITATYTENPVMNLFYMRDQMITTSKGCIIGRMHSPQREKECDIAEFCLRKIGIPPLHRMSGDEVYLEGGDFYPFGNTAFIGCGMRTTQQAIDQLMAFDLLGCDTLCVVKDRLFCQAQMHLDTYFNIIDRDLVTLAEERMTTDPASDNLLQVDIYVRKADGKYSKTASDIGFVQLLTEHFHVEIIPISKQDSHRLANNFLTVGPRRIMAVDGQSEALQKLLRDHRVEVVWLPLDNLKKGYGAAHCMTQVLLRRGV